MTAKAEFGCIGLADKDRTRRAESADHQVVFAGHLPGHDG